MKRLFLLFAIVGLFLTVVPKIANAEKELTMNPEDGCVTTTVYCPDGSGFTALICDGTDLKNFTDMLC